VYLYNFCQNELLSVFSPGPGMRSYSDTLKTLMALIIQNGYSPIMLKLQFWAFENVRPSTVQIRNFSGPVPGCQGS